MDMDLSIATQHQTHAFLFIKIVPGSYNAPTTPTQLSPHKVLLKYRIGLHLLHAYAVLT